MTTTELGALTAYAGSGPALADLRYVEVETSRYCNRTCTWCPNGHTDARRTQELMDWEIFERITDELARNGFAGFFAFHNYNEPLANPRLDDEIARVRAVLPDAKPAVYTNGDLLKRDRLERLVDAGVKYVRITRYPHRAHVAPTFTALRKYLRLAKITDMFPWEFVTVRQGLAARHRDALSGLTVEVIRPSVANYNDRGGTALVLHIDSRRTLPCQMTSTSLSIDFRGNVKMCCNVVPEGSQHKEYVVGNVAEQSIERLWLGPVMSTWRGLHMVADWSRSPACRTCVQALPETRR